MFRPFKSRILETAYLVTGDREIRVARYRGLPDSYQLTIKEGKGLSREEIILDIGDEEGDALMAMESTFRIIRKIRDWYKLPQDILEVDTYLDGLWGLRVGEIEFLSADQATAWVPDSEWPVSFGADVTKVKALKNQNLVGKEFRDVETYSLPF